MPARWRATRSTPSRRAAGSPTSLIELRQDLIATREGAEAWADRLARLIAPLIAPPEARKPQNWGTPGRRRPSGSAAVHSRGLTPGRARGHGSAPEIRFFNKTGA